MTLQTPFRRLQTGVQTGVQTPFTRPADGIQTDYSHTPHTPQALDAPLRALDGPGARPRFSGYCGEAGS
jgi:hypothetical protein